MKKVFLLTLLFVGFQLFAQDYSIFDDSYLHEIRINSDEENFWATLDNSKMSTKVKNAVFGAGH